MTPFIKSYLGPCLYIIGSFYYIAWVETRERSIPPSLSFSPFPFPDLAAVNLPPAISSPASLVSFVLIYSFVNGPFSSCLEGNSNLFFIIIMSVNLWICLIYWMVVDCHKLESFDLSFVILFLIFIVWDYCSVLFCRC